jgi:polyhydroxybutyrate depolymerase
MRINPGRYFSVAILAVISLPVLVACSPSSREETQGQDAQQQEALPVEHMGVQGLRRTVRFYQPQSLARRPALVLGLHGSGGDGERFRYLTDRAFERLADEHGFLVAYPDALGGQWNDCRGAAPYHEALSGIDDAAFLRAVKARAVEIAGGGLAGVFVVGFSNGGHMVFRLALEAPDEFDALAAIAANLPVPGERDCRASGEPVSIIMVSGTADPINPWQGGEIRTSGGVFGHVLSGEATAAYFTALDGMENNEPELQPYPDRDVSDGTTVETRRWTQDGREVMQMVVDGGGHSLPHPTAPFPADIVGRTSRDLNGAEAIWQFFARHLNE